MRSFSPTRRAILAALAFAPPASVAARAAPDDDALVRLRAGGALLLLRHARAPGTGDPSGFRLGDCATQRNLSTAGREQAAAIGARLREAGVAPRVMTSRWCRARDTAALLGFGEPGEAPEALDSFFGEGGEAEARARAALRDLVQRLLAEARPAVLVTHQVNVTALTGLVPAEGEGVVMGLGEGGPAVVGRLRLA